MAKKEGDKDKKDGAMPEMMTGLQPPLELEEVSKGLGLLVPTLTTMGQHISQLHTKLVELATVVSGKADREGDKGLEALRTRTEAMEEAMKEKANFAEVQQCNTNLQALNSIIQRKADASKASELESQVKSLSATMAKKAEEAKLERLEAKVNAMFDSIIQQVETKLGEAIGADLLYLKETLSHKASAEGLDQLVGQVHLLGNSMALKADHTSLEQIQVDLQSLKNNMMTKSGSKEVSDLSEGLKGLSESLARKASLQDLEVIHRQLQTLSDVASAGKNIHEMSVAIAGTAEAARLDQLDFQIKAQACEHASRLPLDAPPSPGLATLHGLREKHRAVGLAGVNRLPPWQPKLM
mmetsp:Transcript_88309/g.270252  ORF Transcript_88309/g.270252 Transcript_88309/m.270252 type:complete len:353 (-) Transcript_88309:109-1167(-)